MQARFLTKLKLHHVKWKKKTEYKTDQTLESRMRSAAVDKFPSLCARLMELLLVKLDPDVALLAVLTMLALLLLVLLWPLAVLLTQLAPPLVAKQRFQPSRRLLLLR